MFKLANQDFSLLTSTFLASQTEEPSGTCKTYIQCKGNIFSTINGSKTDIFVINCTFSQNFFIILHKMCNFTPINGL